MKAIDANAAEFMAAVKGIDAWTVARAVATFGGGSDWRGCTKGRMAAAYADAKNGNRFCSMDIELLNLDSLRRRALAFKSGVIGWHLIK
jgi:hypothetical protein